MIGCLRKTTALLDVSFTKQKIRAILAQIDQIRSSDFAYEEPTIALTLLSKVYQDDLILLNAIDASTDVLVRQHACAHANTNIAIYYKRLGFIIRSTNVRNAFETYDPLLLLCKRLYGPDARLILSSEWEFSPFTFPAVAQDLPDLMFIGLPSTEAGNALIVPLAGHEIGHSLWRKPTPHKALSNIYSDIQQKLAEAYYNNWAAFQTIFSIKDDKSKLLTDLFLRGIWARSFKLLIRQSEELFCDIIGLRTFGEGFLYSFIYLLSPNLGERTHEYPPLAARIACQEKAAAHFSIPVPPKFSSYFSEPSAALGPIDDFIVKMADQAADAIVDLLITAVDTIVTDSGIDLPSDKERDRIIRNFCSMSPASDVKTLGDIINAGWHIHLDAAHWKDFAFASDVKWEVLNDLVYKTMEVTEYERKLKAP